MKILVFIAVSALFASTAYAGPCIQANVQNKQSNRHAVDQNCDVNVSGNIQAGTHNDYQAVQTGKKNYSKSHQVGSGSNTSGVYQRGRVNIESSTQRGRR